jgi:hypothetical protein
MPGLKPTYETLEQIPEALRSHYEPKDGKLVLVLEGAPVGFVPAAELAAANGKVAEFRDTNIALLKEVEPLRVVKTEHETFKKRYEGIDPTEVVTLRTKVQEFEKNGVKDPKDIGAQITAALEQAVTPLKTQLETLGQQLETSKREGAEAREQLVRKDFEATLSQKALKAGADERMLPHFVDYAQKTWKLENGTFVAKNGAAPIFSEARPHEPMTPDEWIAKQVTEAPGFFKPSGGGGAGGGGGLPGGIPGAKPGARILKDPTPQELGKNADAILKGDVVVQRSH